MLFFGKIEIMKKLLGILVLGLLWCNVGIAAKYSKVKLGMGKVDYCNIFIWSMKNTCYPSHVVYAKDNIEIHKAYNKLHIFQNVSRYIVKAKWGDKETQSWRGFGSYLLP